MHPIVAVGVVLLPLALSLLVGMRCPMSKDAGQSVEARPPPWVFAVVWPVLFFGLGVALLRMQCKWPAALLVLLLPLWQVLYAPKCASSRKAATWLLVAVVAVALVGLGLAAAEGETLAVVAMGALAGWVVFAQQLAVQELQSGEVNCRWLQ